MPDCFIIMPISTPEVCVSKYADDEEHFKHVLDHLFIPALDKAGYKAIPPIAKGSDLIHASIIKHIEKADLVLCDMSTLNPNVFFEFGIRTAVNKPVCIVKDDKTERVPFDATVLNYHEYSSGLELWKHDGQIENLVAHIQESAKGSDGQNSLWKYFGLSTRAELTSGKATENDKIALLNLKVDGLMRKLEQERPKLKQERFKMVEAIPVVQERIDRVGQRVNATVLKAQELGIAVLDLQLSEPDGAVLIVQPEEHNKHRFPELIDFASKLKIRLVLSSPSSQ